MDSGVWSVSKRDIGLFAPSIWVVMTHIEGAEAADWARADKVPAGMEVWKQGPRNFMTCLNSEKNRLLLVLFVLIYSLYYLCFLGFGGGRGIWQKEVFYHFLKNMIKPHCESKYGSLPRRF